MCFTEDNFIRKVRLRLLLEISVGCQGQARFDEASVLRIDVLIFLNPLTFEGGECLEIRFKCCNINLLGGFSCWPIKHRSASFLNG